MNTPNALAVIVTTLRAIAESAYALAADHVAAIKLLLELRNSGMAPGCVTDEWVDTTRIRYIQHCAPDTEHSTRLSQQLAAVRVAIEEGLAISEADVEMPAADDEGYPAAFLTAVEAVLALPDVIGGGGALYDLGAYSNPAFAGGTLGATARTWANRYSRWLEGSLDDTKADDDLREATEALRAAYAGYREQRAAACEPNASAEPSKGDGGLLSTGRWSDWQGEIRAVGAAADIDQWLTELREVLGADDDENESAYSAAQGLVYMRKHWHTMWCEAADKLGAVRNALGVSLGDDVVGKARHLTERLALAERKAQDLDETRAVLGAGPNESVAGAARCLVDRIAHLDATLRDLRGILAAAEGETVAEAAQRQMANRTMEANEILSLMDRIADRDREIAQLRTTMADQTSAYEAGAAQHGERYKDLERELKQARNQAAAAEMAGDQALAHVRADHEAQLGAIEAGALTPELASAIVDAIMPGVTRTYRAQYIATILALRPVEVYVEEGRRDTPIGATPPRPRPTWRALADVVKAYLDAWDKNDYADTDALDAEIGYLSCCIPATDEDGSLLRAATRRYVDGLGALRRALADWTLALAASSKENP